MDKIYFLNRYRFHKTKKIKKHSGYEQLVKYSDRFSSVEENQLINKFLKKHFAGKLPKDYWSNNLSKELQLFFKALVTGQPVFYLYADKDAFLLPLLKRKFKIDRIKIFGTLHWAPEQSKDFSFYKHNFHNEFTGIIGLSSTISTLEHKNIKIIPHGIDLTFWHRSKDVKIENKYLIIGVSNRDHQRQINTIESIKRIDPEAKFLLIAKKGTVRKLYKDIPDVEVPENSIDDQELKLNYQKAKAIILFQKHCLASNLILEAIAMQVPVITNLVGDVSEYLGTDYPLFVNDNNEEDKLREFCLSDNLSQEIKKTFVEIRSRFDWKNVTKETVNFISRS